MRDSLSGANNALIRYVGLGTSNTAPAATDTKLGAENMRKAVTSYANGLTGEIVVTMYLTASEAIGLAIAEVGFFGGSAATSAINTGILIARGLYSHTKASGEALEFRFDLTAIQG